MKESKVKHKLEENGLSYFTNRYLRKIQTEQLKKAVVKQVKEVVVNG